MAGDFRQLEVYRRAVALAGDLYLAVARWPSLDQWSVGLQIIRAADSVGATIAEANGRWHDKDRRRLLWMARGSLHETEHWILQAEERGLLERGTAARIDEIARPLNGLIQKRHP